MITCKNCASEINTHDKFCSECGAKVINDRISIKNLTASVIEAIGWDSKFIITLRHLVTKPQNVFMAYIGGTRKKYANPFAFLAIILTISLFIFTQYGTQYIEMSSDLNFGNETSMENSERGFQILGFESAHDFQVTLNQFLLKFYNFAVFLLLPIYALMAYTIYRKPYNYSEHLIICAYITGMTTLFGLMLFLLSLRTNINFFANGVTLSSATIYLYAYARLYQQNYKQILISLLKFIGLGIILFILLSILGAIIGVVFLIYHGKILT